jgi:hypothetical protein
MENNSCCEVKNILYNNDFLINNKVEVYLKVLKFL